MTNRLIKLAAILPLTAAASATAAIPPSAGNMAQQPCEVSRVSSLRELGQVATGRNFMTKDRKTNVGNLLKPGDLIYYVALVDGVKYYTTPKQIEIIDGSPMTPDVALTPAAKYESLGIYKDKKGRSFDLVAVGGFIVLVNEAGMVCSTRLDDRLVSVAMPTVYQELPIKAVLDEAPVANPRRISIAVTVREMDAATLSLDMAVLINGKAQHRRTSTYDLFSGQAKIGDLELAISRTGSGGLKIDSIAEPANYDLWIKQVFRD